MDILGSAASLFTGGAAGAAGGLLGSVFGFGKAWLDKRHQRKVMEIEAAEKEKERAHDLALMDREAEIDLAMKSAEVTGRMNEADMANIRANIEAEAKEQETLQGLTGKLTGKFGRFALAIVALFLFFAEFVRKMMRPVITTALVTAMLKIYLDLGVGVADLEVSLRLGLLAKVVNQVLFLTGVAVCFWFLSRPHAVREMPQKIG